MKDIAAELDKSDSQIRKWKNQDGWYDGLTDKQRLFCMFYVRSLNENDAYKKAFGWSYNTAMGDGHHALINL